MIRVLRRVLPALHVLPAPCLVLAATSTTARAQFTQEIVIDASSGGVGGVHAADLDGDGDRDILVGYLGSSSMRWYPNLGGGNFGSPHGFPAITYPSREAITIDLGADGDLDIISAAIILFDSAGYHYRVDMHLNLGGGSFSLPITILTDTLSSPHLQAGDFEGDGDLDLFVARSSTVTAWINQAGPLPLSSPIDIAQMAPGLSEFRVLDLDGDSDADFVYSSTSQGAVLWFENPGSATLFNGPVAIDSNLPGALGVDTAQLDADGLVDVVGVGWTGPTSNVKWTGYLGASMFGQPHTVWNAGLPQIVRCEPIDADADMDLFVAQRQGAVWFSNDGQGGFSNAIPITTSADYIRAMTAADLDGGGVDLILSLTTVPVGNGDVRIVWFRNSSHGFPGYCAGDGSGMPCPCGNSGSPGHGCANSVNAAGAHLSGMGIPSLSTDTVVLTGSGMPNGAALYFQGTQKILSGIGAPFGDGLRCAGGTFVRLGTKSNAAGASSYPGPLDVPISIQGNNLAGTVRYYQAWYRNAAVFCTPDTYNLTDAVEIAWVP